MSATNVLYDHQAFEMQRYGGISRYFYELMTHANCPVEVSIRYFTNEYLRRGDRSLLRGARFVPERPYKWFKGPIKKANEAYSIERLQKSDASVFHATYHRPYFLPHLGNKKYILTVHDMNYELMPDLFPKAQHVIDMKRETIERADRLIAISENTKRDLIDILKVDPAKIDVIYHGVRPLDLTRYESELILPKRYVLFVGDRRGYKNFHQLLEAYAEIAREDKELHLLCTGRPFHKNELKEFATLGVKDRVLLYSVNDYDLATLYQRAELFVFPSLYEGFGLPILEAFSYSCPTILSNASCFPEIAGDAALYFDPNDVDTLLQGMKSILNDDELKASLREKGLQRAKLFTWEKTAEQTLDAYQTLLSQK